MSIEAHAAERAILSILIKEPDRFFTINDILLPGDFVNTGSALIYEIIKDLIVAEKSVKLDKHIIIATAEQKNVDGFYHHTLNGELIDAIVEQNINANNFVKFVAAVKQASLKRALINKCEDLKDDIELWDGKTIDMRNMVETSILDSLKALDTGEDEVQCLADNFEETINNYADLEGDMGIDIGLRRWQRDVGYIRNGAITGIFASTKVGKSQLSMWSAFQAAVIQRKPVLYLDTELQLRQQQMRLCGIMTGIPYNIIESGKWKGDREQIAKVKEAFAVIRDAPIYYKNIAGRSVHSVIPLIRKFVYKNLGGPIIGDEGKGLVIYDYIKLMDSTDVDRLQEYQLIGLLMSSLHDCAAHLNIPIMALGQLNKQEDIGIRRIVENVDSATILRPKKLEELQEDGPSRGTHVLEARFARNGCGHSYNEWVNVHFDKSCGQFKEDKRNSEIVTVVKKLKESLQQEATTNIGNISEW
jgi:replicative DNA helicase